MSNFHVLIGPNASGKTTFLEVVSFLGRLVSDGLEAATEERTKNFSDLLWGRSGSCFELAIEAAVPAQLQQSLGDRTWDTIRYEVSIGIDDDTSEVSILSEKSLLKVRARRRSLQRSFFPEELQAPASILSPVRKGTRAVVHKKRGGNDNYYPEVRTGQGRGGWMPSIKLGPRKSALGNIPEDEKRFPVSTWLKRLLTEGVQELVLNSLLLRNASPPGQVRGFKPDGSNLPWVIDGLSRKAKDRFRDWIAHLRTALPDIQDIRTVERKDDKHRYLVICYDGGLEVPSWVASDGTLRLLALTLPAYLPQVKGVYLIEEPENGVHPRAVETMFQSLSSVYDAQILLATHSPIILSVARPNQVLCFTKTPSGATDVVLGSQHPKLKDWRQDTNLSVLFASGVLS